MKNNRIVIAGAGSIGCFVGGLLVAMGQHVTFLGRKRTVTMLQAHGLRLTDYTGLDKFVPASKIAVTDSPDLLKQADIILVTVKSGATDEMGKLIAKYGHPSSIIISLQNGIRNADRLRDALPEFDVRSGMVPFNVVQMENGRFHRATSGNMVIEAGSPDIASILNVENLAVESNADMSSVLWGKLLINLNNATNALSGLTLIEQLSDRNWRKQMAELMLEGLSVMKAAGINPNAPAPVPAFVIPYILRLPTPLFRLAAKQMFAIDPEARSSMCEDIRLKRITEVEELQGEIIALGKMHNVPTPVNERVRNQIKQLEANF